MSETQQNMGQFAREDQERRDRAEQKNRVSMASQRGGVSSTEASANASIVTAELVKARDNKTESTE